MVPAVEFEAVTRLFGDIVGLDHFNLQVAPGTITVLVGPNGAGKTTAVRVITGALRRQSGAVRVFGNDPLDDNDVRRRTGVVAAKPALYDRLTGRDNLQYAADLWGVAGGDRIVEAAEWFGIAYALGLRVGSYSTGMKTRLALTRAILTEPDLLLLDEPTSGLDPESAHAVLGLIHDLAQSGKTIVMCTHLLLEAEGLADQVVLMEEGRDILTGAPDALARQLWPSPSVVVDAENPAVLDTARSLPGVIAYERNGGPARVTIDDLARVPDLVAALCAAGARLTQVAPHRPTLEELYFAARARSADRSAGEDDDQ